MYSDNQKTLQQENDFLNQVISLKSPMSLRHGNCAVKTDPFTKFSKCLLKIFAL